MRATVIALAAVGVMAMLSSKAQAQYRYYGGGHYKVNPRVVNPYGNFYRGPAFNYRAPAVRYNPGFNRGFYNPGFNRGFYNPAFGPGFGRSNFNLGLSIGRTAGFGVRPWGW